MLARVLTGLLMRSVWLLPAERAEWLEGLVAEPAQTGAGRSRVAWLLGGVWLLAGELLRRSAARVLTFIVAAGIVVWLIWPGRSSDAAVPVNRVLVPLLVAELALLPLLVRRFYGPRRHGWLPRTVRVVGYLVVLATAAGHAVEQREGQKLGAYFGSGFGRMPVAANAAIFALVLAGYAAAILILTSRRVRLSRLALPIALATGTLTGVALSARFSVHLWSGARGTLVVHLGLGWWGFVALGLPLLTGFMVSRLAARDTPATGLSPARQGSLAAVSATGTAVLVLAALTAVTIAISPQKVPLRTPPPPPNGGCESCDPVNLTIPSDLRHEYWVGLSIASASRAPDAMLVIGPMFALFAGVLGTGLAEASRRIGNRYDSPHSPEPPSPAPT
ncbi:MAG: hypothetical protein JO342_19365 [Solirubrobacterales bacterium]|nr:hypothetical protein [Solirubrobacterales bacterium]